MSAPKGNQGIYKITSPSGRVYVGQTLDFPTRFAKYRLLHCHGQIRLFQSFKKYGVENHRFEVLEICDRDQMNCRERYYQDFYNVLTKAGLNCKLTSSREVKGRHSEETKRKIALAQTGRRHTPETIAKFKMAKQNMSEETKHKIRLANLGKKMSESTREKQRIRMTGNKYTIGVAPVNARKVLCTISGRVFNKIHEAAQHVGLKDSTLGAMLRGDSFNRTTLKYL